MHASNNIIWRKKLRKAIKDDNNKKKNGQEIRVVDSDSDINNSDNDNDSDQHVENELGYFIKPKHRYIPDRSKVLKWLTNERKVDFIVAPYEADAQLAYLANNGMVDAVVTEDSDLIAFGCPNIIYNMSVEEQTCDYYSFSRLKEKNDAYKKFTPKMLMEMCIMIGCDYLPNMKGIGISKAHEEITKWGNYNDAIILTERKMELRTGLGPKDLKTEKREIIQIFEKAIMAFTYQLVYNPMPETCERLSHMSYETIDITLLEEQKAAFLGPRLKNKSVRDIAKGYRSSEIKITDVDYWEKSVEKKRKLTGQMFIDKMFPRKNQKE
ncbi:hypothetical protein M0R45_038454 [Rubus argutus]|uniref:XPG-I domain-containing protein n=1 Tax=Rubus argutus TaxID=59490 RepID=A0AAW1W6Q8_RUBAR